MPMQKIHMKPSLLVALKIGRVGGVEYSREDLDGGATDGTKEVKVWKVVRTVPDVPELKAAEALASACRRLIAQHCVATSFGLVASKDREADLTAAYEEVQGKVADGNATFKSCQLRATCVRGEIVTNDQAAADAILKDIGTFFTTLQAAIASCDAKTIRETCATMKGVDTLLGPEQSEALKKAVAAAKMAATKIVAEVEGKGAEIKAVMKSLNLSPIDAATLMFIEPMPAGDRLLVQDVVSEPEHTPDDGARPVVIQEAEVEPLGV